MACLGLVFNQLYTSELGVLKFKLSIAVVRQGDPFSRKEKVADVPRFLSSRNLRFILHTEEDDMFCFSLRNEQFSYFKF